MYLWRRLTVEQRQRLLRERQANRLPWHGPPHYASDSGAYLATATCYEHRAWIGQTTSRMGEFESGLLTTCASEDAPACAWTVLPNHYHLLLRTADISALLRRLGQLHGRKSFDWNAEDGQRGRKVWHRAAETGIKSERHFWATLMYVHNNAVRHGYVKRWQDWPYSSASKWLTEVGHDRATEIWKRFPIDDYGKDWDPPDL